MKMLTLKYSKNIFQILTKNWIKIKNSIIIMDNMSSHLTSELFENYNKYKLKVLFNVPYKSI